MRKGGSGCQVTRSPFCQDEGGTQAVYPYCCEHGTARAPATGPAVMS